MFEDTDHDGHRLLSFDGSRPIDGKFWAALNERLTATRPGARSLSLYGGADFGVGVGLKWMATTLQRAARTGGASAIVEMGREGRAALATLMQLESPTFALVSGEITGGHAELALAADFRVGIGDCTLYLPEPEFGIVPDYVPMSRLVSVLGRRDATHCLVGGQRLQVAPGNSSSFCEFYADSVEDALHRHVAASERFSRGRVLIALRQMLDDDRPSPHQAAEINRDLHTPQSLVQSIKNVAAERDAHGSARTLPS